MEPSAKVMRLVQRCLADLARHPVDNVDVYLGDDVCKWVVALHFSEAAPFIGGAEGNLVADHFTLYASLSFTEHFPAKPPKLCFLSPWINHQHLWGNRVCHSLLSDDFADFFREQQTHGTSMWNASCALADSDGLGGLSRYLQVLREFLASDPDYVEEKHVRYDADSLLQDVEAQRSFRPDGFEGMERLESVGSSAGTTDVRNTEQSGGYNKVQGCQTAKTVELPTPWGTDFFLKTALLPGDADIHPCFDVTVGAGRVPSLATTMTLLCKKSFDLGARSTDFGSSIDMVLPCPCSREAWASAGRELADSSFKEIASVVEDFYQLKLPNMSADSSMLELILSIVGEIWKTTCISIVRAEGHESERAMTCFVTLHFLLLCLAEDYPGLRAHAVNTVRQFLELIENDPSKNLKTCVPDLGRFLVRFLLTEEEMPFKENVSTVVRELFNRNVRWVDPDLWADGDASDEEKELQVEASFASSQFGMKLTVFQSYYVLRSVELGLDSLTALESCGGRPAAKILQTFQADYREIKEMETYAEFFLWLHLTESAGSDVHQMLCAAVDESEARSYNEGVIR